MQTWSTCPARPDETAAARDRGDNVVVVLGHPAYDPRFGFGFGPASRVGITAPFDAPDDAFLALALDPGRSVPHAEIVSARAAGI